MTATQELIAELKRLTGATSLRSLGEILGTPHDFLYKLAAGNRQTATLDMANRWREAAERYVAEKKSGESETR